MITNFDCTLLTKTVTSDRDYTWDKCIYKDVYFESYVGGEQAETSTKPTHKCYCCIYGITSVNAHIGDIIVKGAVKEDVVDITSIKNTYVAYSISKISIYDTGRTKHVEIEGM